MPQPGRDRHSRRRGRSRSKSPGPHESRLQDVEREHDRARERGRNQIKEQAKGRDWSRNRDRSKSRGGDRDRGGDRERRGRQRSGSRSRSRSLKRQRRDDSRNAENRYPTHARSRSRSRDREKKSRRRSRSTSASSANSSSHAHRKRKKDKGRRSSRSRERKERKKEKKREKKEKKEKGKKLVSDWGKFGIISESDIFVKEQEFRTWLVEERKVNPETISKEQNKKEFARFVEDYNTATLPHEKYYHMAVYEGRMAALRAGEFVPPPDDGYDPAADLKAHASRHKRAAVERESYLSKEQLAELRRVQQERVEAGKMKLLGMDIKQNMGVRMDGTVFDD